MNDALFVRGDVPMTKREVRALALDALDLAGARHLLDVGAGTGSVSVQAAKQFPSLAVTAIEREEKGIALIRENAARFGVAVRDVYAEAPCALEATARYDRVFLGGTGRRLGEILEWLAPMLEPNAVLVMTTITIESFYEIVAYLRDHGDVWGEPEALQIQASRLEPLGSYRYFKPQNPCQIVRFVYRGGVETAGSGDAAAVRGTFYGIGVGPGDPELLTDKAIRALRKLNIVVAPAATSEGLSEAYRIASRYVPPQLRVETRHFPMTKDTALRDAELGAIAREIVGWLDAGFHVGFLTLGDPMVYATYAYLLEQVRRIAPETDRVTIPGITSFGAIASAVEHSLVEGDEPLVVFPCTADGAAERVRKLLMDDTALVLMKVYRNFDAIRAVIDECGLTDAATVSSNFGKENEITAPLRDYPRDAISYFTTILVRPLRRKEAQ